MFRWMLLRHAKSDWSNPNQTDFERPLNARGKKAAPVLGQMMLEGSLLPDTILCSTAVRAQETMLGLLSAWDPTIDRPLTSNPTSGSIAVESTNALYLASPSTILLAAERYGKSSQSLLVIGHNPGMEMLASQLAGYTITMKTAQLIVLVSETGWPSRPGLAESWHLQQMLRPENE